MVSQNEPHVLHHGNCETVKMVALQSLETGDMSADGSLGHLLRGFRCSQLTINVFMLI